MLLDNYIHLQIFLSIVHKSSPIFRPSYPAFFVLRWFISRIKIFLLNLNYIMYYIIEIQTRIRKPYFVTYEVLRLQVDLVVVDYQSILNFGPHDADRIHFHK